MAVGDIVNFISAGATSYVPAGTVEIVIFQSFWEGNAITYGLQDGTVNTAVRFLPSTTAVVMYEADFGKMGITNAIYYKSDSNIHYGFSGIHTR